MTDTSVTRVAVLGAGRWGPNLLRVVDSHPDGQAVVVADPDESRLRQIATRFPGVETTTDASEAIGADVDAVIVATPTSTHHDLVRAALEAGRHVMVEKPLTDELSTSEALADLADQRGLVLLVGHTFVYNPGVRRAKEFIADGSLGKVRYAAMERTGLGPIRRDVDAAWDLASHDVSIANFWLGAEPLAASAVGGAWINEGTADAVFATLRYPDDVLVNVHASWLHPRKSRRIALVGERRMLTFDDLESAEPIRVYDKNVSDEVTEARFTDSFASFRSSVREGDITIPKVHMSEPLGAEVSHFLSCVQEGEKPITDARFGIAVVRALEAISRSAANGGAEEAVAAEVQGA
jgi:predicted dehydrogenase